MIILIIASTAPAALLLFFDNSDLCGQINDLTVIDCDLLKPKESADKYLLCDKYSALKNMNICYMKYRRYLTMDFYTTLSNFQLPRLLT